MAFCCSPNSVSSAKPSCPARDERETTGNTTLIDLEVTPRVEVLADWREAPLGPELADSPPVDVAAGEETGGALATQIPTPASTAPTTATVRSWVERGRRTKWPHERATPARGFQRPRALIPVGTVPWPVGRDGAAHQSPGRRPVRRGTAQRRPSG